MNVAIQEHERNGQTTSIQQTILICLFLLGIWIFAHPWEGIWHDSRLYALQALSHLRTEAYRNDIYFLYGSQDKYTLFSPIYAGLVSLLNLYTATIVLLLAGYILWVGSAALLLHRLLRSFPLWLGLILIFSMPRGYGSSDVFRYAEPFLTPRLISEGLTLLSLAMLLRGKWLASFTVMVVAFAIHPLMALAGAGFIGIYLAQVRTKAALGAGVLGLLLLFSLTFFKVAPFSDLLATMDSQWYKLAFARLHFEFWGGWKQGDWNRALLPFSILITTTVAAQGVHRRVFLSSLIVGCSSLLLTWVGTSLFHNVLLIEVQPWRSLWLTQLFSYIAAAWLVAQFWDRDQTYRFFLLGFLVASLTLNMNIGGGMLALLVASLFIWQIRTGKEIHFSKISIKLLSVALLLAVTLWVVTSWLIADAVLTRTANSLDNFVSFMVSWIKELLADGGSGIITLGLFLLVWRYGPDHRKFIHLGTVLGVLLLLLLSIVIWYRPNSQESYYEQRALKDPIPSFSRHIPVDAVVYWGNDPKMSWFALGRSNYASYLQATGIVFSRKTAIEVKRRLDRLTALGQADSILDSDGNTSRLPKASLKGLVHVCHDPVLDFVVLSKDFGKGIIARYYEKATGKYFYLYDCVWLRHHFADTWNN